LLARTRSKGLTGSRGTFVNLLLRRGRGLTGGGWMAQPLLEDARRVKSRSLKYFHVDSYESGNPSWSPRFALEFQARRGYGLLRWMPVLAGRVVESRETTHRFLWDIRRTIADLYAANYYGRLAVLSHQAGIAIHPESSGPFYHHIDGLQCAGLNDIPMTEFWKREAENKEFVRWLTGQEGFSDLVKQAASAAHTYGRPIC
jgi:alpha-L-rhamnosidase